MRLKSKVRFVMVTVFLVFCIMWQHGFPVLAKSHRTVSIASLRKVLQTVSPLTNYACTLINGQGKAKLVMKYQYENATHYRTWINKLEVITIGAKNYMKFGDKWIASASQPQVSMDDQMLRGAFGILRIRGLKVEKTEPVVMLGQICDRYLASIDPLAQYAQAYEIVITRNTHHLVRFAVLAHLGSSVAQGYSFRVTSIGKTPLITVSGLK